MGKITGNKGEWSEMYAFLKILSDNRIYGADGELNKRDDIYYDVCRIIRNEGNGELDYYISDKGDYAEVRSGDKVLVKVFRKKVAEESEFLLESIVSAKTRTFSVEHTEQFMNELKCTKLKAPSKDKSDITLQIHDHRTGMEPVLGFSIKSNLGSLPTLLNPGKTTNFIFRLDGNVTEELVHLVNGDTDVGTGETSTKTTLAARYQELISAGIEINFDCTETTTLEDNLRLINYKLPDVVAEMLKLHYIEGINSVMEMIDLLNERNPLKLHDVRNHPYYAYMVKKLLVSYALGMQSATPWDGFEDASGGYIVVRHDGEVLCYHLYNRNDFEDYLIKHTKLDTPSTTRYDFSKIYKSVNGRYYLKLNLQIRFT